MTILEAIREYARQLEGHGVESPRWQVEWMLAQALAMPRLHLYLNGQRALTASEHQVLKHWIERRACREPLQYILGSTSFCGLELKVTPAVLIPRPETELLAERAWRLLNQPPLGWQKPTVALDYGTGSGCLAITLAVHAPQALIYALDISEEALLVARHNAEHHRVSRRIHFLKGEDLAVLPEGVKLDLIVTNPPYIPSAEIDSLQPEVRDFEPRLALNGGPDGLHFYRYLAQAALPWLSPSAWLLAEIGEGQAEKMAGIFQSPAWHIASIDPDDTGRLRLLTVCRTG